MMWWYGLMEQDPPSTKVAVNIPQNYYAQQ